MQKPRKSATYFADVQYFSRLDISSVSLALCSALATPCGIIACQLDALSMPSPVTSNIYEINRICVTYDHRLRRTEDPVRSPFHKPQIGRVVVGSVTTSEFLLLYVFFFFALQLYAARVWVGRNSSNSTRKRSIKTGLIHVNTASSLPILRHK